MDLATTMLQAALSYAGMGLPVVPLHSITDDGSCTCGEDTCHSPGKHPRTRNGLDDATIDQDQIKKWWSSQGWPNASIGGVCGEFLCLDIDTKSSGQKSLEKLIKDNATLPLTAVAQTGEYNGERGTHYWFIVPDGRKVASKVGIRNGIDIRAARGYAVLPPSKHLSGVNYEWLTEFEEVVEAPDWLLDLLPEPVEGTASWEPNPKMPLSKEVRQFLSGEFTPDPGEQRDFLTRAARAVLTTGKSVNETTLWLYEGRDADGGINACTQSREPWTFEDVLYLVEDIFRKNPSSKMKKDFTEGDYSWDDVGNGHRLVDSFQDGHAFFVSKWNKWYLWDVEKKVWVEDDGVIVTHQWEKVTDKLLIEAVNEEDGGLRAHVKRARSKTGKDNALHFGSHHLATDPTELNADPFLLNCPNGILDLQNGKYLDPDPKYKLTKQVKATYDPEASSPLWDRVLLDLLPNAELRAFVKKIFGYTLTGSTEEHKFFYFHGPPGAGKTTLLEAFAFLMGQYSEAAEPSTFMAGRNDNSPREDVARLSAARMVTTHEVAENARWAEDQISHYTGGDKVTARFLHQNSFEFYPQFKLFFSANHKPRVSGNAQSGIWRRIIIVPFEEAIPEKDRDPALLRKLREPAVLSAILNWAIEGALEWMDDYKAGTLMEVPQMVKDEVRDYQMESDHVMEFLGDHVVVTGDQRDRYPRADLYDLYRSWCDKNGRRQYYTKTKFNRAVKDAGHDYKMTQYNKKVRECWFGIQVTGVPKIRSHE